MTTNSCLECWGCGVHNGPTLNHIHLLCKNHHILLLAIMEPMSSPDFLYYCKKISLEHSCANPSNKIWVFWAHDLDVSILSDRDQVIDLHITSNILPAPIQTSFVYAKSTRIGRRDLWNDLRDIADSPRKCLAGMRVKSDPAPLLFSTCLTVNKPPSMFRYMKMWARHNTFLDNVAQVWNAQTSHFGLKNLYHKLISVKQRLNWWNRNFFRNVFDNHKKAEHNVLMAKRTYDANSTPTNLVALNKDVVELILSTKIEEDFWHKKSSCKWLVEGERKTSYFHKLVKYKRTKARIHCIQDNGVLYTLDNVIQLYHEEIKQNVFGINPDSVVGPDGFSTHFYQHCWHIIHKDVCEAVRDFFDGHPLPKSFIAIMIPKKSQPLLWTDYRPISLCNVTSKIITKLLNDWMATLLPQLISLSQIGFVRERLISNNVPS
ncbi:hypothetical protein DH2020_000436 [Rehmannia glutinosa]|uniref:Reverse transcriptase domain-containing protein n=1 Tax=Rehmannia glutinosa TaxID=99300 RepID=A0ABR0XWI8_REHGL